MQKCADTEPVFHKLMSCAEALTPYATLYRYPDEIKPADLEQAHDAVKMARTVFDFVKNRLG